MPKVANAFVFTLVALASLTLVCAALLWNCPDPARFAACACLALLASTLKVRLPGMDGCISPNFVPVLFAVGSLSWQETVVMAAAAGGMQTLWKPRAQPPQVIQILFNAANLSLAAGCAYAMSHALAGNQILVELAIAALVYEVLNTLGVSTVIQLITGSPLAGIWRNCHLWTFPYVLAGAVVALIWIQADLTMGLSVTVLGAVGLYLMSTFYQELVNRAAPQQSSTA